MPFDIVIAIIFLSGFLTILGVICFAKSDTDFAGMSLCGSILSGLVFCISFCICLSSAQQPIKEDHHHNATVHILKDKNNEIAVALDIDGRLVNLNTYTGLQFREGDKVRQVFYKRYYDGIYYSWYTLNPIWFKVDDDSKHREPVQSEGRVNLEGPGLVQ